jgi:drug/metabolite transporter (DMT)-like permease
MSRIRKYFSDTTFLAIVASLLWASAFAGVKIGLKYHTPFQFAGVRFMLSGLMLILYYNHLGNYWRELVRNWQFIALIALLQTVIQYMLFYSGVNLLPASIAAMITGSSPLFISVVAHFMVRDDRMDRLKLFGILTGVAGVAVISLGRGRLPSGVTISLLGVSLLLINNVFSGWANVLIAKRAKPVSPVVLSASSLFFGGIGLLLISIPVEGYGLRAVAPEYFVSLGWLSFLSAAAFAIWYTLLQRPGVKVSQINMWKFLIPVAGAILSWILIPAETPDWISVSGMLIIAASLLVNSYSGRKKMIVVRRDKVGR